jgi:hypothetical protein
MDRYAQALQAQNEGGVCPDCRSALGHFSHCPLLNRNVAEAQSATLSESDTLHAHALGISW